MPPKGDLQLSIGYWIVSHKQTLRTWWGVSSMIIIAACLLWTVFFFSLFFSQERKLTSMFLQTVAATGEYTASSFKPKDLIISPVNIIARDNQHVDLVTDLANTNLVWGAEALTVHFVVDGVSSIPQHLFLNQDSTRPVVQINALIKTSPAVKAELVIDEVQWARATDAALPAATFTINNLKIDPSTVSGQALPSVTIRADVMNQSVYNFYRVDIPIVLLSGTQIVGAGYVTRPQWATLTSQEISLTLAYPVNNVTTVRIEPQVSRFDYGNTYR